VAQSEYAPGIDLDQLRAAHSRLLAEWPTEFSGSQRDHAALKNLTSVLIGRFTRAAERATRAGFPESDLTRYRAHLLIPPEERDEVAVLKGFANLYVMQRPGVAKAQERQRELIHDLAGLLWEGAPAALSPEYQESWAIASDDSHRLRVVVDQVASLTDNSARALHRALKSARD
jgi:dGTPase